MPEIQEVNVRALTIIAILLLPIKMIIGDKI